MNAHVFFSTLTTYKGIKNEKCKLCKGLAVIYSPNTGEPYCSEHHMVKQENPNK